MKTDTLIQMPKDVLKEMEQLQILGGTAEDDVHVYAIDGCKSNTYCEGGNCVAQCACVEPPVTTEEP